MHITWKGLVTKAALGAIAINALTLSIAPAGYTLNRDRGFGSGEGQLQINGAEKPVWDKYSPTIPSPDLIFDQRIDKKSNTYLAINVGPIAEPIGGVVGRVVGGFGGRRGAIVGERVGRKVGHHTDRGLSKLHHRPIAEPIGGVVGRVVGSRFGGRPGATVGKRIGRKVGHHTGRGLSKLHHLNRGLFKHF
ncbi:MAG: hypothetical protein N4J56_007729 [Chroococcidiopsis sp. SAG 2025]|uniref:hypothetical protein n=1 Tax=Chroococcidiopsis sp. SAG 2025 TaxID=171389 RepID=UPI00293739B8|nr:hypothetical protein [Chroococcidiopsis sp. SAG 2025]MDV2998024.1 hypothetical protein [Chroococcidiopsis sp. SAG 2025]